MLSVIKQPQKLTNLLYILGKQNKIVVNGVRPLVACANYSSQVKFFGNVQSRDLFKNNAQCRIIISRPKSRAKKAKFRQREEEDDSDEEEEAYDEDEYVEEDGALVKTYSLNSVRVDVILKQVLNQKRKKIEENFYNNKIRLNGRILFKKSENVREDDVIDLIKGIHNGDPGFLEVSRVEILNFGKIKSEDDKFVIKTKKYKSLVISNYEDGDAWKEPEPESQA